MSRPKAQTPHELLARAAEHPAIDALRLQPRADTFDDSGLDFRVVHAVAADGARYVVKEPRRDDVSVAVAREAAVLARVADVVPVAVPRWLIATEDVVVYRRLAGTPLINLEHLATEGPRWTFPLDALPAALLDDVGAVLAALMALPPDSVFPAADVGALRDEARQAINAATPIVSPPAWLAARWRQYVDDDALWRASPAVVHGDLHPGHLLVDEGTGRLVGVLDWSEGKRAMPDVDLAMQLGCLGEDNVARVVAAMRRHGVVIDEARLEAARLRWLIGPAYGVVWALQAKNDAILDVLRQQVAAMVEPA